MTNHVETAIDNGHAIQLGDIEADLNSGNWDALYFATESQISKLIEAGRIDEDFASRHQEYREEMRCMMEELK